YVAKFLYNKASNAVRNQRAKYTRNCIVPEWAKASIQERFPADIVHDSIAFAHLWEQLDVELRVLWIVLLECGGNQSSAGRRLGKHSNTIAKRIRTIQQILESHGFNKSV